MNLIRKISCCLTALAFLLTLVHAAIPHHHHGDIVCFGMTCEQHDDCDCGHDDDDCAALGCHHHHHPLHSEDNCILTMPYITAPDGHDIASHLLLDYTLQYHLCATPVAEINCQHLSPTTHDNTFYPNDIPIPQKMNRHTWSHRGPPCPTV